MQPSSSVPILLLLIHNVPEFAVEASLFGFKHLLFAHRKPLLLRFILHRRFLRHLPCLNISDPFLEVLDGHKGEVKFWTELGHVGIEIDSVKASNDSLLLGDTDLPKLFSRDNLRKPPSKIFDIDEVKVLEVGSLVGKVLNKSLSNVMLSAILENLWHEKVIISLVAVGAGYTFIAANSNGYNKIIFGGWTAQLVPKPNY